MALNEMVAVKMNKSMNRWLAIKSPWMLLAPSLSQFSRVSISRILDQILVPVATLPFGV